MEIKKEYQYSEGKGEIDLSNNDNYYDADSFIDLLNSIRKNRGKFYLNLTYDSDYGEAWLNIIDKKEMVHRVKQEIDTESKKMSEYENTLINGSSKWKQRKPIYGSAHYKTNKEAYESRIKTCNDKILKYKEMIDDAESVKV